MTELKKICKFCKWLDKSDDLYGPINLCSNPKIHELSIDSDDNPKMKSGNHDELIYTYHETGAFHVGDNFGCIHWEEND